MKLSIAAATYNEEANIKDFILNCQNIATEIIVVDGSSTDKTATIARQLGAKIYQTTNKPIFHLNKQMAINKAKSPWILQLDADERLSPELKKEILTIIKDKKSKEAYCLPRKNFFLGKFLKKGGQYPDYKIRLFKKNKAYLPCKSIHEDMIVKGKIGYLKNDLLHFTAPTFSRYLQNSSRYTDLTAQEYLSKNLKVNIPSFLNYLFFKPLSLFIKIYLRHKGYQDGFPGFVFALFSALHIPIAYIKFWEIKEKQKK
jgi:glycosyltransferase involved in cell wall biosynthesis